MVVALHSWRSRDPCPIKKGDIGLVVRAYVKQFTIAGKTVFEKRIDVLFDSKVHKDLISPDNIPPSTFLKWLGS
jgi:hypothetical protein